LVDSWVEQAISISEARCIFDVSGQPRFFDVRVSMPMRVAEK